MKFKVGDKVRIKSKEELEDIKDFTCSLNEKMKEFAGDIAEISKIGKDFRDKEYARVKENDWSWDLRAFEILKVTKQELLDMPIGTKITTNAENEDYRIATKVRKDAFEFLEDMYTLNDYEINDDLTLDIDLDYGTKIIKIEKPTYETVYDYKAELREMTVAEIEKELGHPIKIIKED